MKAVLGTLIPAFIFEPAPDATIGMCNLWVMLLFGSAVLMWSLVLTRCCITAPYPIAPSSEAKGTLARCPCPSDHTTHDQTPVVGSHIDCARLHKSTSYICVGF